MRDAVRLFRLAAESRHKPGVRIMNATGQQACVEGTVPEMMRAWYGKEAERIESGLAAERLKRQKKMATTATAASTLVLSAQLEKDRRREAEEVAQREEKAVEEAQRRASVCR